MADEATPTTPGTTPPTTPPKTGGTEDKAPETKEYTIKSVNTGLQGEHIRETLEVDGESYGPGDKVGLTEVAHKSLVQAGVEFEGEVK